MKSERYELILAVFPNAHGIAYAAFEGPYSPVDCGVSDLSGPAKNRDSLHLISALIDRLEPDALVIRDLNDLSPGRHRRLRILVEAIERLAEVRNIPAFKLSREQVRQSFEYLGSPNRYVIALAIAKHVPLFQRFVPPVRKIWKSEDRRMGLFDAIALVLSFYQSQQRDARGSSPTAF